MDEMTRRRLIGPMTGPIRLVIVWLILAMFASATTGTARTLNVGTDRSYKLPSLAAADARDGDEIVIDPGEYFDCAVWKADNLTIRGASTAAKVIVTDKTCMGKAIFVVVGNNTTVRDLTLTRARVADMNGAGIRLEGRNLLVDGVKFINNQEGILGGGPGSTVVVRNSQFLQNGSCSRACAHGLYVGEVDLLRVEQSTFFETRQAHHIKSRALRTEVVGCNISDGENGTSSFLIETPNGGTLIVRDSSLEKGPRSENHEAAISIGTEGVTHPTKEILIENNRFRNDGDYRTIFVRNLTATPAVLIGNQLSGSVTALQGDGSTQPDKR